MRRTAAVVILAAFTACATVGNGPLQRVAVSSDLAGATVQLHDCGAMSTKTATLPATVWVSRRATQCRLTLTAPAAPEQTFRLSRHVSRSMKMYGGTLASFCEDEKNCNSAGDLLGVGIVGSILLIPAFAVDFATGSMFEQKPNRIAAQQNR